MGRNGSARQAALRIAVVYLIVGGLWILLSDRALTGMLGGDEQILQLTWLQTVKGWFYICVTAVMVGLLVYNHMRDLEKSKAKVVRSEEHYRSLFTNSPIAIWDLDLSQIREQLTVNCNHECVETCTITAKLPVIQERYSALIKLNDVNRAGLALVGAEDVGELQAFLPQALTFGALKAIARMVCSRVNREADNLWELPVRTMSGKQMITLTSMVFPPGSRANWRSVHLSLIDITERKQILSELQTHQKLLLEAERIAQAGSWEWRVGQKTMRWDLNIFRLFGLTPTEAVHVDEFWKRVLPEDCAELRAKIMKAAISPGRFTNQFRVQREPNDVRHLWLSGESFTDENFHRLRLVGWVQDVTARIAEEDERRKLEAQLRHAQKMESLGALAGGIAHDFNNILTPLYGYTELSMQALPDGHPVKEDLRHVIKAAGRGRELVQQILAFSRQIEQERKPIFVHHIVKEVLRLLQATIAPNIKLVQRIDSQIGAVLADPAQIHQVVMNLCINATYAMKDAGGVLTVDLGLEGPSHGESHLASDPSARQLRLSVSDTGCGMDETTMARIFEPFFTTKPAGVGTGLGLSVSRQIIANHGGTIQVKSKLNEGSTFTITLPLAPSLPVVEHTESPFLASANQRLLFVDDDPEIVGMAEQMLRRLGYRVESRTKAEVAIQLLSRDPDFDLIITDQSMPGMTGLQLARDVLHLELNIPVILMTGEGIRLSDAIARKNGITEYLPKPFSAFELSRVTHRVLSEHRRAPHTLPADS